MPIIRTIVPNLLSTYPNLDTSWLDDLTPSGILLTWPNLDIDSTDDLTIANLLATYPNLDTDSTDDFTLADLLLTYPNLDVDSTDDVTTFLGLTDTPNSYIGAGSKYVAVKATADGLEFVVAPTGGGGGDFYQSDPGFNAVTVSGNLYVNQDARINGNITSVNTLIVDDIMTSQISTNAATVSGTLTATSFDLNGNYENTNYIVNSQPLEAAISTLDRALATVSGMVGGAASFLALTDTPSSYTGYGNKTLAVSPAENAVSFVTPSGIMIEQRYAASDTWIKPANCIMVDVEAWGPGAGGSGGAVVASGITRYGGSGGGGGAYLWRRFSPSDISDSVTVTIGLGGSGGAGRSGALGIGNAAIGSVSGDTYFGTYLKAGGGGRPEASTGATSAGGNGGCHLSKSSSAASGGRVLAPWGGGNTNQSGAGYGGGKGGSGAGNSGGSGTLGDKSVFGGCAGGGGGGATYNAGVTTFVTGSKGGGLDFTEDTATGGASLSGQTDGANGTNGTEREGGGGGAGTILPNTNGGNGGKGGNRGGGGGGGGAAREVPAPGVQGSGGTGGDGGDGYMIVRSWIG